MAVLGKMLARKTVVLSACQESINAILGAEDDKLEKLRDQANELAEKARSLISLRAQVGTEQKAFEREYKRVTSQYERIVGKIEGVEKEKADRERRVKRIRLFMMALEKQEEGLEFDAVLVSVLLEKVVVSGTKKDVRVRFILADGSEWEA